MLVRADTPDAVCGLAWDLRRITCVIDELDLCCSQKKWSSPMARELAHYGRHRQVDLFGSFRFTRNINEDLPALADFVFLLRHSAKARFDLLAIQQRFGADAARTVVMMPDHHAVVIADGYHGA